MDGALAAGASSTPRVNPGDETMRRKAGYGSFVGAPLACDGTDPAAFDGSSSASGRARTIRSALPSESASSKPSPCRGCHHVWSAWRTIRHSVLTPMLWPSKRMAERDMRDLLGQADGEGRHARRTPNAADVRMPRRRRVGLPARYVGGIELVRLADRRGIALQRRTDVAVDDDLGPGRREFLHDVEVRGARRRGDGPPACRASAPRGRDCPPAGCPQSGQSPSRPARRPTPRRSSRAVRGHRYRRSLAGLR